MPPPAVNPACVPDEPAFGYVDEEMDGGVPGAIVLALIWPDTLVMREMAGPASTNGRVRANGKLYCTSKGNCQRSPLVCSKLCETKPLEDVSVKWS